MLNKVLLIGVFLTAVLLVIVRCSENNQSPVTSKSNEPAKENNTENKENNIKSNTAPEEQSLGDSINQNNAEQQTNKGNTAIALDVTLKNQSRLIVESNEEDQNSIQEDNINNPQEDQVTTTDKADKAIKNDKQDSIIKARNFTITSDDIVLGNKDAKVVMLEYFSPTCPHCVTYHRKIFPEIKKHYIDTNKITYVIREFVGTKQDLAAALLARCKGDADSYLSFMNIILQQQKEWAYSSSYSEKLTNIGMLGGVSPADYANCLNNNDKIKTLQENTLLVYNPGFGTPSFFINLASFIGTPGFFTKGKQFAGSRDFKELKAAIDNQLAKVN